MHDVHRPRARVRGLPALVSLMVWSLIATTGPVRGQPSPSASACTGESTGLLRGVVREDASKVPLAGARILAALGNDREPASDRVEWTAEADEDGSYTLCVPLGTRLMVWATYRDVDGQVRRLTARRNHPRVDLDVSLGGPAYLLFSVTEAETGRPVPGAAIRLEHPRLVSLTDSAGRAVLPRVPPGRYDLEVSHIAYRGIEDSLLVVADASAELEVRLATRVLTVEPIRVTVTGRDPYLVRTGFYDRMNSLEGPIAFFYEKEAVQPYVLMSTFVRFKKEIIAFGRPHLVLIDGRPMRRLGYERLEDIPMKRIRGVEFIECRDVPARVWALMRANEVPFGDCRVLLIWTR